MVLDVQIQVSINQVYQIFAPSRLFEDVIMTSVGATLNTDN